MKIQASRTVLALCACILMLGAAPAETTLSGKPRGQVLASTDNRIVILSQDGKVVWEHPTKLTHDAWKLPNGNILFGDGESITEVTMDHKVVFRFQSEAKRHDATYGCQRLSDGNTLVAENATGRILEVNSAGKIVFSLQTEPFKAGQHHNLRLARKLANGNYLVCHSGAHLVREYRPTGEVVQEIKVPNIAFGAIRTPRGTTLVASLGQITEFDKEGKKVWEFANSEAPGLTLTNMAGMHLLADGSVVIGFYGAYGKDGKGCGMIEISREKKVAWHLADPKFSRSMLAVQMLDESGNAFSDQCLR